MPVPHYGLRRELVRRGISDRDVARRAAAPVSAADVGRFLRGLRVAKAALILAAIDEALGVPRCPTCGGEYQR